MRCNFRTRRNGRTSFCTNNFNRQWNTKSTPLNDGLSYPNFTYRYFHYFTKGGRIKLTVGGFLRILMEAPIEGYQGWKQRHFFNDVGSAPTSSYQTPQKPAMVERV